MRGYLKRLSGFVIGWIFVLWICLNVGWRFYRWRLQLWFRQSYMVESTHIGMKQTLLFIRHGQTTWNVEHRRPGQLPGVALDETGRQQAARLADALTVLQISAIISNPLERARDTAEIIAQPRKLEIQYEPELMDLELCLRSGQNYDELSKNHPAWKPFPRAPPPAPPHLNPLPQSHDPDA